MRLIGTFDTEKRAFAFYSLLLEEGIQNIYESYSDADTGKKAYRIWIYDEDDWESANEWFKRYQEHPEDPLFQEREAKSTPPPPQYTEIAKQEDLKWQTTPAVRVRVKRFHLSCTHLILFVCALLFLWNSVEKEQIEKTRGSLATYFEHTSLEKVLLYDYPANFKEMDAVVEKYGDKEMSDSRLIPPAMQEELERADEIPAWKGLYHFFKSHAPSVPLFAKIREGQVWRLFTPCLLHFDFLHILFNMAWVWVLAKQIEERLHWKKLCILMVIIGIVSNTAQYLMSGPSFLGFSGIIVGMAGFIWMRQRKAPWEGYPLNRTILLFLVLFVVAMVVLGFFAMTLKALSLLEITPIIANTAHVVGGLTGMYLGRWSYFSRGKDL